MSAAVPDAVRALVATQRDGEVDLAVTMLATGKLGEGDVTVRVDWSSVNYKDALATVPGGKVARISPLVPGIDLAGEVVASESPHVPVGTAVLVHGHELGTSHHGGYAELARVPWTWVVPLPDGMTGRQAMVLGTAGFTAALSVVHLEAGGLQPGDGPVLVTGATGGVGSTAVAILAGRGYEVVASTGKPDARAWLRELGAAEVLDRDAVLGDPDRPLERQRWAGAVDCVGGAALAGILRSLRIGGAVAASGLTGGSTLATTVFPFILRGVALLGVDSVNTPAALRADVWRRLAGDLRPAGIDAAVREIPGPGQELLDTFRVLLDGRMRGRAVVRMQG